MLAGLLLAPPLHAQEAPASGLCAQLDATDIAARLGLPGKATVEPTSDEECRIGFSGHPNSMLEISFIHYPSAQSAAPSFEVDQPGIETLQGLGDKAAYANWEGSNSSIELRLLVDAVELNDPRL